MCQSRYTTDGTLVPEESFSNGFLLVGNRYLIFTTGDLMGKIYHPTPKELRSLRLAAIKEHQKSPWPLTW